MNYTHLKLHWSHKLKLKRFFLEGYTNEELAIMYKVPQHVVVRVTRLLSKPERI